MTNLNSVGESPLGDFIESPLGNKGFFGKTGKALFWSADRYILHNQYNVFCPIIQSLGGSVNLAYKADVNILNYDFIYASNLTYEPPWWNQISFWKGRIILTTGSDITASRDFFNSKSSDTGVILSSVDRVVDGLIWALQPTDEHYLLQNISHLMGYDSMIIQSGGNSMCRTLGSNSTFMVSNIVNDIEFIISGQDFVFRGICASYNRQFLENLWSIPVGDNNKRRL